MLLHRCDCAGARDSIAFRTIDRGETRKQRSRFAQVRRAENQYASALRSIAKQVGSIVKGMGQDEPFEHSSAIREALGRYAELIKPWARATGARMLADVDRRDVAAWNEVAGTMSRALAEEIKAAPTGEILRERLRTQVELITSLPLEAAQRVHKLTLQGLETGTRASEAAKEIMRSGHVCESRAMLIARTETARTASALVEARSLYVGSDGYIWRTVRDNDVRKLHRRLEGKFIAWSKPPVAGSNGETAHAGQIYNCRCWPEPVLQDIV